MERRIGFPEHTLTFIFNNQKLTDYQYIIHGRSEAKVHDTSALYLASQGRL